MIWQGWLFVGLIALYATSRALRETMNPSAIVHGIVGFVTWLVFGYQSLNVVVVSNGTELGPYYYAPVALLAAGLAVMNLYVAITGPIVAVADDDRLRREVT
jgi:hypothetical protein